MIIFEIQLSKFLENKKQMQIQSIAHGSRRSGQS